MKCVLTGKRENYKCLDFNGCGLSSMFIVDNCGWARTTFRDCLKGWMVWRFIPGGGEIFCTDQPRVSELLHSAYWIFPGVKHLLRAIDHPPQSTAEVKEKAEL